MTAGLLPSTLDLASGMMLPEVRRQPRRPWVRRLGEAADPAPTSPRDAIEQAILPGLLRPPCLVSFSGGRDSAAVLAVAVSLARREGLPLPIPATNVIPGMPASDEDVWQTLLVRHLGLRDWIRLEHDDELDLVGPYAQRVLHRYGVVWPPNAHFHLPLLDAADGGSLLTGVGGDEFYAAARALRAAAVVARHARPRPRDLATVPFALAPAWLRQLVIARRSGEAEIPWLTPRARRRITRLLIDEAAAEPLSVADRLEWWQELRYMRRGAGTLDVLGRDADVQVSHPLLSPAFWHAAGSGAGASGFASRTAGVRRLFADVLPIQLVERSSKSNFDAVFWTPRSRGFAREWSGGGVPVEWVDEQMLAAHWRAPSLPRAQSGMLVQAAWLWSAKGAEQTLDRVGH